MKFENRLECLVLGCFDCIQSPSFFMLYRCLSCSVAKCL